MFSNYIIYHKTYVNINLYLYKGAGEIAQRQKDYDHIMQSYTKRNN